MKNKLEDIKGIKFHMLTPLKRVENNKWNACMWECLCDCGKIKAISYSEITRGKIKSCGCYRKSGAYEIKHGHARNGKTTKEYHAWTDLKNRCNNPKSKKYKDYGGRGISVCARWMESFENFLEDMGIAPKGTSIDRTNNDGNYEPSNCKWVTMKEQVNNRRCSKKNKKSLDKE